MVARRAAAKHGAMATKPPAGAPIVERVAGWSARRSRLWAAVVGQVVRSPLVLGLATVTLLALAAPVLSPHLEDAGIHDLPANVPVVRSLLDIQRAFPGGPEPAKVVVTGSDLTSPAVTGAVARLHGIKGNRGGAVRGFSRGARPKADNRKMPFAR